MHRKVGRRAATAWVGVICAAGVCLCAATAVGAGQAPATTEAPPDADGRLEQEVGQLIEARRFDQAAERARELVAARERVLPKSDVKIAEALMSLAEAESGAGRTAGAMAAYRQAIEARSAAGAEGDADVATISNELAVLYYGQGDSRNAEPLLRRAIALRERALGPDAVEVAQVLNNLSQVLQQGGDYAGAAPPLERALAIYEKGRGPDHPDVAIALNNLAALFSDRGDYARAEPLYERAIRIWTKADGEDSASVAQGLNNLGLLHQRANALDKAQSLLERALAIRERTLQPDDPNIARVLNNLAIVHQEKAELDVAEALYTRALAIYEKRLGPSHPLVGQTTNNLAVVYLSKRNYERAGPMFERAVAIRRAALGPEHPDMGRSLTSQAIYFDLVGRLDDAVRVQADATENGERNLRLVLATGAAAQKLRYMETFVEGTDITLSLYQRSGRASEVAQRLALTTVLRRKGRVLDAVSQSLGVVRQQLSPEGRAELDELANLRSGLARLVLQGPGSLPRDEFDRKVQQLEEDATRLESAISARSSAFAASVRPVSIDAVQSRLDERAALVEYVQYRPFDPLAVKRDERFKAPRYLAFVVHKHGPLFSADLGPAGEIDALVETFRREVRNQRSTDAAAAARALEQRIFEPLEAGVGAATTLVVSPDAALNLVPFAALVDGDDRPLVDRYLVSYVTSGRDVLGGSTPAESRTPAVVVANPEFGPVTGAAEGAAAPAGAGASRAADLRRARFLPLPGTAGEADAIARVLPDAQVLTGATATEHAVKGVHGPRILHLATHGFFLDDTTRAEVTSGGRLLVQEATPESGSGARLDNPLLRSGLAFAGANRRDGGDGEDGILTALEATALDLWGTRLAVLSACETGVGETPRGDGVYGLRRALVMAGAETQLMTLWPVSDIATRDLMSSYYKQLAAGAGRAEALRAVQQEMRAAPGRAHPYYWASFILSGATGPLTER
jgi:CHAT domain-containing protein/Tfp pilus assembly protein PilF